MRTTLLAAGLLLAALPASAATPGFADLVVEFFDGGNGSLAGPQGGVFPPPATMPNPVGLGVVLGDDPNAAADYLSLPTGTFVTVGFTDEDVVDGPGDDFQIQEVGSANETADVYVSPVFSTDPNDFELIGTATANVVTSFDLSSIGFVGVVRSVKVVGLDTGGAPNAPGFDLANIRVLNSSTPTANVCFANGVIQFFDAGNGTLAGPQGGTFPPPAVAPMSVDLSVVVGSDPAPPWNYLSLPTDSFVTVSFAANGIVDGDGADLFVTEVGSAGDTGDVYVSSAFSTDPNDFTFLGTSASDVTTAFDLASIGFTDPVHAVKIVGRDTLGAPGAPGFDVANVSGLNCVATPIPVSTLPSTSWFLLAILAGAVVVLARRS